MIFLFIYLLRLCSENQGNDMFELFKLRKTIAIGKSSH